MIRILCSMEITDTNLRVQTDIFLTLQVITMPHIEG